MDEVGKVGHSDEGSHLEVVFSAIRENRNGSVILEAV